MNELEKLEKRWFELVGKPRTKEEIEESAVISQKLAKEYAKEHLELTKELARDGIFINTIWDMVNTNQKYPNAIPILLRHLKLNYSDRTKEGIVRALTVKEAKGVTVPVLIQEFEKISNSSMNLKWAIGNAVNTTITKEYVESIFPIVLNKENGISRQMFVVALGKFKLGKVKEVLEALLKDDDEIIRNQAKNAIKKFP